MPTAATRVTTVLAVLIATLVCASPALAKTTQTASAPLSSGGTVSARLTWTKKSYYDAGIHLTITRDGKSLFSRTVTAQDCGHQCVAGDATGDGSRAIHVVDIQGNGEPEVMVDLYTGGAHCCSITQFYTYDAANQTYHPYAYFWGDPGYSLEKLGGKSVFETANDAFAYEFTDFAASGLPLQLFSFDGTKLINVTRQYPKLIAADAARYLTAFKDQASDKYSDTVGVIAAWAADEDELGNSTEVATYLKAQAAAGHLNTQISGYPAGARFITKLNAFLRKTGYLAS